MQVADRNELTTYAHPALAAQLSDDEFGRLFPVPLHEIADPDATPEPSMGALLKLKNGATFVMYFGLISKQLTLRIPPTTNATAFLKAFLREVPLPLERIIWHRADVTLPRTISRKSRKSRERTQGLETFLSTPHARRAEILDIIHVHGIDDLEELQRILGERRFAASARTITADLRELGINKPLHSYRTSVVTTFNPRDSRDQRVVKLLKEVGHPGIEWITPVEMACGKAEKANHPRHRLSRFPTRSAAAASR